MKPRSGAELTISIARFNETEVSAAVKIVTDSTAIIMILIVVFVIVHVPQEGPAPNDALPLSTLAIAGTELCLPPDPFPLELSVQGSKLWTPASAQLRADR